MNWQVIVGALLGILLAPIATMLTARVPGAELLWSRPRCRNCAIELRVEDQIPIISWVRLRGRCRSCGAEIGIQVLVAELLCIAASVVIFTEAWPVLLTLAWLCFIPVGVALALIDLRHKRLPNILTLRAALALVVLLGVASLPDDVSSWVRALEGSAALFTAYLLMNLLTGGAMGMGDVKLALSVGLLAGFLGWTHLVLASLLAFVTGGLVSAALLIVRRAARRSTIPFGPFMLLGLIAAPPLADLVSLSV